MYQAFKKRLIEAMEMRRDMIVLRSSRQSLEPIFEVSTADDKLYRNILNEFDITAVQYAEKLLCDLCVKYGIPAELAHNKIGYDLLIPIDGNPCCIDLKTSTSAFSASSMARLAKRIEDCPHPVYLVFLLKDNRESRKELEKFNQRMQKLSVPGCLEVILFDDLLRKLFGKEELHLFRKAMLTYKEEMHQVIGYQITEIFTPQNLDALKTELEQELKSFDYDGIKSKKYIEIRQADPAFHDLYSINYNRIKNCFIEQKRYKMLLGEMDFAKSFLTSEWLYKKYFSLEEMDNTFIISGYLKSVEQLLWDIIYARGLTHMLVRYDERGASSGRIDNTLGSLQFCITSFSNDALYEPVFGTNTRFIMRYLRALIDEWRRELRNGYFHKDNLTDRGKIDAIRDETIFLYLLILGSLHFDEDEIERCAF